MAEQGGRFKVEPVSSPVKDEVINIMVFSINIRLYEYYIKYNIIFCS